ncbi:hypothetical protein [uncultured Mucilaginibacter sp.]|uniref:hypothetical protein n=1 Tax=uncultured Mucilaginibacter sp. TaxID=797541 RepID=UPI0025F687E3|nr:hypothetical protein [uncultured Mucilaginibacter sp.]
MAKIFMRAAFGETDKHVEISDAQGCGCDIYYVMIDRRYCGRVWLTENYGWRNDVNPKSELTTEDISIIIEMICKQDFPNFK